jgi:hypothetical protein
MRVILFYKFLDSDWAILWDTQRTLWMGLDGCFHNFVIY